MTLRFLAIVLTFSILVSCCPGSSAADDAQACLDRARQKYLHGMYKQAMGDAGRCVQLKGNAFEAYSIIAASHFKLHEYNLCIKNEKHCIAIDPQYTHGYYLMMRSYEMLGNNKMAEEMASRPLTYKKDLLISYRRRGDLYTHMRQKDKALSDYAAAFKLAPNDPKNYQGRAQVLAAFSDFKGAARDYAKASELDPANNKIYFCNLGAMEIILGNYKQALPLLNKAVELDPKSGAARNNRGVCYEKMGELEKAAREYDAAIHINPKANEYFNNESRIAMKRGDFGLAVDDLLANRLDEDANSWSGSQVAITENFKIVLWQLSKAIKANPDIASNYYSRGVINFCLGNFGDAASDFETFGKLGDWSGEAPAIASMLRIVALRMENKDTLSAMQELHVRYRKGGALAGLIDDVENNRDQSTLFGAANKRHQVVSHLIIGLNQVATRRLDLAKRQLGAVLKLAERQSDEYAIANSSLVRLGDNAGTEHQAPLTSARTMHKYNLILHY